MAPVQRIWRAAICSAVLALLAVTLAADALTPPAVAIADRSLGLAAILVIVTVLTFVITSGARLGREARLAATVTILVAGMGWYSGRLWVHEKQFDYLVRAQKTALRLAAIGLSANIVNFLRDRARSAPPHPMPSTWQHDVDAVLRYDAGTALLYEQRFGPQVRRTCELLALEGLTDPDLTMFYRAPATAFQIEIVAEKLAALGRRLERT